MNTTRGLMRQRDTLLAERESREARGVPVPDWVETSLALIERQLASPHHAREAENMDEAEYGEPAPLSWLAIGLVLTLVGLVVYVGVGVLV